MADTHFHLHRWSHPAPRAALLVIHGMAEHGARYARLAAALNARGIAVYAPDLPGHGLTGDDAGRGHFADAGGWALAQTVIGEAHAAVAAAHPGVPVFALGHSLGSLLLQDYVLDHGAQLRGAIFSATTGDLGALRPVALALLSIETLLRGRRHRSALAERLSFKEFNRRFAPNRTPADWLSRDQAEVDKYVADPLCGFRCTTGLWLDLLRAAPSWADQQRFSALPKTLPVLLVNGGDDPVTNGDAGPAVLERRYRAAGLTDVTRRGWPGARHELLNETCREEVTGTIAQWLEQRA